MSRPPSALPTSLTAPVFTRREAVRAGVRPDRLLAEDITWIDRGLYSRIGPEVRERDIVAAYTRGEEGVMACGITAARIWGLPLPWEHSARGIAAAKEKAERRAKAAGARNQAPERAASAERSGHSPRPTRDAVPDDAEDAAVAEGAARAPGTRRRVRRAGAAAGEPGTAWAPPPVHLLAGRSRRRSSARVVWHRRQPRDPGAGPSGVVLDEGTRVTSRLQTWQDLAAVLSAEDLTIIGDHLVRIPRDIYEGRTGPHCTVEDLVRAAARCRGPGAKRLRQAVADVRVGSDSPAETRLRLAVRAAGLPEPVLNRTLNLPGAWLGTPDLAWPEWKVCVEHEGAHHREEKQFDSDITRTENRQEMGWLEVRTVATDLRDSCARGVARIARALREHGWHG
ncbi:hypothetical protein [Brachybacterium sp. YJGR34]|uniref:hypothetical protein n=1 Tax=Brachybacterium sp. YJGR34 TaxID=2059911 RepID=UPI001300453A|nr:hypothetical protein [Brachybacterium sp. YJGR34]